MPTQQTLDQVLDRFQPGISVFVPGMSGECLALYEALRARPEAAEGVTFRGALFPGINRSDYLGLHPQARQRAYFMQPELRAGLADGRAEIVPTDYPGIVRDLARQGEIDIAFVQVAPPDDSGRYSLGVSCDFQPVALRRARHVVALVNPQMPRTRGTALIDPDDIDVLVDCPHPLLQYDGGSPGDALRTHASRVAALVRDGDTLEFGVGKLQAAILDALSGHRRLQIWSGMVSTPALALLDSGAVSGRDAVNVGVALGNDALYERCGRDEAFCFRPVSETHEVREIALHRNFCAINSAVEVDLLGQVNADTLNGRLLAGVGGLPAFAAGALLSEGGRSIIALPAATDNGKFSRIVSRLGAPGACALPRHAADYVVTEHGAARLSGLDVRRRAKALIAIADPRFRESLEREWVEIEGRL